MTDLTVPGDKSIAHRFLILASLADGESRIRGVPESLDVRSTVTCLRQLGVGIEREAEEELRIVPPRAWRAAPDSLDCGNSGTTARLLAGLLAGLGVAADLTGDQSLRRRPMDRVVYPLQAMGARIRYLEEADRLPVRIEGRATGSLRDLRYRPRVSSAQVRGALLLAALTGGVDVEIRDRRRTRDHTERILEAMGAPIERAADGDGDRVLLAASGWRGRLDPLIASVPGDISSAAFLVVAALLRKTPITVRSVGLNPSRSGFLTVLRDMGADVRVEVQEEQAGEPMGRLQVRPAALAPFRIAEAAVPVLVDEIPALVALASRVPGVSEVRGATELRVKESDRVAALCENLSALGVRCEELPDGLRVSGGAEPLRGTVRTSGDHRIAMAFGALGVAPGNRIFVDDPHCVDVSFPGYWEALATGGGKKESA